MVHHKAGSAIHPQLFSMKEVSNTKTKRVKVTQYDPLYLLSTKNRWTAIRRTRMSQGEHCQRNVLKVFLILSGPVGNPESSSFHRRSPKSKNQSQNYCQLKSGSYFFWPFKYKKWPSRNVVLSPTRNSRNANLLSSIHFSSPSLSRAFNLHHFGSDLQFVSQLSLSCL